MNRPSTYPLYAGKHGFALLVTIVLIAFLVLILVALSSLSRVETRAADNSQQVDAARQNALMALNVAIGELQRTAGPDQRATARAEITSTGSPNQPYWTGVWDETGALQTWLVSGNSQSSQLAVAPTGALDPSSGNYPVDDTANGNVGEVFLLGNNSLTDDAAGHAQRIRLPKQEIKASAGVVPGLGSTATPVIGHYAYWVSDEGVKASAAYANPFDSGKEISWLTDVGATNDEKERAREHLAQIQLPRVQLENVTDFSGIGDLNKWENIRSLPQLTYLSSGPDMDKVRNRFHDLTPLSEAVLANSADGGLREDFSSNAGSAGIHAFRDFRVSIPDATKPFTTDYLPQVTSGTPALAAGPVLSEFALHCVFTLAGSEILFTYGVDAEFWNPYASRLVLDAASPATPPSLKIRFGKLKSAEVNVHTTDGSTVSVVLDLEALIEGAGITQDPDDPDAWNMSVDPAEVWQAGEIKMVSGAGTASLNSTGGLIQIHTGKTVSDADGIALVSLLKYTRKVSLLMDSGSGNQVLQTYAPPDIPAGNYPGGAFAYGFSLNESLPYWMDPTASGHDPRNTLNAQTDFDASKWPDNDPTDRSADNLLAGLQKIVLFDLPRQDVVSVGSLRNLVWGGAAASFGNPGGTDNANFDKYYFSSIPRNHPFPWNFAGGEPLPNFHLRYSSPENTALLASDIETSLKNEKEAAAYLLIKGAFNINSTSVEAWKAILGANITGWQNEALYDSGSANEVDLKHAIFRLPQGAQQLEHAPVPYSGYTWIPDVPVPVPDATAVTTGGRQLEDTEVADLVKKIVDELKTRGKPFNSLQDFLNDGLLQRAINDANLNGPSKLSADFQYSPAAVTQADIAELLAPFATARSDTFLVRTYGDAVNPVTGVVTGRAWCEAIVQRIPEYMDAGGDDPWVWPPSSQTNQDLGRKFKIVSFRWLSASDL